MPEISYPPISPTASEVKKKEIKVDKPGVMAGTKQAKAGQKAQKAVRFRPLRADKRGRPRKLKDDPRYRIFY